MLPTEKDKYRYNTITYDISVHIFFPCIIIKLVFYYFLVGYALLWFLSNIQQEKISRSRRDNHWKKLNIFIVSLTICVWDDANHTCMSKDVCLSVHFILIFFINLSRGSFFQNMNISLVFFILAKQKSFARV